MQAAVDATSYALLLYFTALRLGLKKATRTARCRCAGMSLLLLYLITANVLAIVIDYPRSAGQQVLSFLILMFFIRSLRESWKRIFLVVWDSLAIMVIILAYLLFFSLIGYTLFANPAYVDPEAYFRDIPTTIFNVYVLFTTSNFPDILFPFWKVNNWTALYFVGFLLVGLYMLLNLMLAVFYNSYKTQIEAKIAKYDSLREDFLRKEFRAAGRQDGEPASSSKRKQKQGEEEKDDDQSRGPSRDHISPAEFRAKYGPKVIEQSEKVLQLLKAIENERDLGVSDGLVYYEDFAYMYMFLEFSDHKKQHFRATKQQARRRSSGPGSGVKGSAAKAGLGANGSSGLSAGQVPGEGGNGKLHALKPALSSPSSAGEGEEASSEDSFESDSDFEGLNEDFAAQNGRGVGEAETSQGYKRRNWCSRRVKRYRRKAGRTGCGKCLRRAKGRLARTRVASAVIDWYESLYSGGIMLAIGILNLMTIPYLHYYESLQDWRGMRAVVTVQLALNSIYLVDFLLMLAIFGFKEVLFKRSWALRMELPVQLLQLALGAAYAAVYRAGPGTPVAETAALFDFLQLAILVRLLRIFSFLSELEQWRFFMKAVKVMRGPFFNLGFTLYSLFYLYVLIGMEIFGGKISSAVFKRIFDENPDTEIAPDYIWLNFNDYASGLITLEAMMLFNNWQFIWRQFEFTIGDAG